MRKIIFILALTLLSLSSITSMAQTSTITSFQGNGVITWTNDVTNAVYRMEWASTPTGTWYNSWEPLRNIMGGTNLQMSAQVPMFYRVTMIPEVERITVYANPTVLATDGSKTVITVSGGVPPYTWTRSSAVNGILDTEMGENVVYTRTGSGDNAITATDDVGDKASVIISQP